VSDDSQADVPFHLIVRLAAGKMPGWRGTGWVCVEHFAEEHHGRDRFHVLRPALDGLQASAALIRGTAQPSTRTVTHDRTVISRDAEFWTLRSAEIRLAGRELADLWQRETGRLVTAAAAREAARLAMRRPARNPWAMRANIAVFATVFVTIVVGTRLLMPDEAPFPVSPISAINRDGTTVLVPDPKDPSMMVEYELHPDGTRTAISRIPRSQKAPDPSEKRPRTLAEGVNMFLRVRQ
jgi:hypothetical protein